MAALDVFPTRVAFTDENGYLTRAARQVLLTIFERVGGADGPGTGDLAIADDDDSGLEETKHEFAKLVDGLAMQPIQEQLVIEQLQTELAGLREQVAVLTKEIDGLKMGTML